jgi:hypothetical protein
MSLPTKLAITGLGVAVLDAAGVSWRPSPKRMSAPASSKARA